MVRKEEPFSYQRVVLSLKRVLEEKRVVMRIRIQEGMPHMERALYFEEVITDILESRYFASEQLEKTVEELMQQLLADDKVLMQQVKEQEERLMQQEYAIQMDDAFQMDENYSIPDEMQEERKSRRKSQEMAWNALEAERVKLQDYKRQLRICRQLKGIIARPNRFFQSVYQW